MADLYHVTTDYLLGRPEPLSADPTQKLSPDLIRIFDGRPAWSENYGWVLVNGPDCMVTRKDGTKVSIEAAGPLRAAPDHFAVSALPESKALTLKELVNHQQVWVEPITLESRLRDELRGWYQVKGIFVENSTGNRFLYDTYGSKWLAFEKG